MNAASILNGIAALIDVSEEAFEAAKMFGEADAGRPVDIALSLSCFQMVLLRTTGNAPIDKQ